MAMSTLFYPGHRTLRDAPSGRSGYQRLARRCIICNATGWPPSQAAGTAVQPAGTTSAAAVSAAGASPPALPSPRWPRLPRREVRYQFAEADQVRQPRARQHGAIPPHPRRGGHDRPTEQGHVARRRCRPRRDHRPVAGDRRSAARTANVPAGSGHRRLPGANCGISGRKARLHPGLLSPRRAVLLPDNPSCQLIAPDGSSA